jgi:drug/metabolite transporter (DMT)-like permease
MPIDAARGARQFGAMTATPEIAAPPVEARRAIYPYLLLLFANLFWASNWVIGRGIHEIMPPVALSFWRWAIAGLALAPFALPRLKGRWPVVWRHRKLFLILGATGIAVPQCIVYIGLNYTTAVNGSLLTAGNPFVMVLTAWLLAGETATWRQFLGMALSFLGVLVIVAHGSLASLAEFHFNPGDLLIVLSIPIWCVYTVLLRRRPREIDGLAFLFLLIPVGLATLSPAYVYEAAVVRTPAWSWQLAGLLLYIGLTASAGSYLLWNRGVELVGPNRAAFTNPFQPIFAATLAILLLGEAFHAFHALGFALIIVGWYLTSGLKLRRGASGSAARSASP